MDDHKRNQANPDDPMEVIQETFNHGTSERLEEKLRTMLDGFRRDLKVHPYLHNPKKYRFYKWRRCFFGTRPLAQFLALTGAATACLFIIIPLFFGNESVTWADVEEQFRVIPSCAVSVYVKPGRGIEPTHVQYWIGKSGRIRIHEENKITFAKQNEFVRTFNITTRREMSKASWCAYTILRALDRAKKQEKTTLKSIIEAMAVENIIEATSIVISDEEVSRDLVVFDAESYDTLWFVRVWALRESKLPVRILKWHRQYDRYEEILFTYSKAQPPKFFDPDAFAERLKDPTLSEYDLKYLFLRDPGGKPSPTPGS